IGGLPIPGGFAAEERDRGGDGTAIEEKPVDRDFALHRERRKRRLDEAPYGVVVGRRGPGATLPSARFERKKILDRGGNGNRLCGRGEQHGAEIGQPSSGSAP